MSRTINKPEDAKPLMANLFTDSGQMVPNAERVFTAAECAQIARSFRDSSEADCTWDEWESNFREWGKQE